jgi:hypothetical protein
MQCHGMGIVDMAESFVLYLYLLALIGKAAGIDLDEMIGM